MNINNHLMRIRFAFPLAIAILFSLPTPKAQAHPEGFSGIHVTIHEDHLRVAITVHTRDMGAWFPPGKYPDYVADVTAAMEKTVDEIVELQFDSAPQQTEKVHAFLLEVGLIEIDVDYKLPPRDSSVELLIWSKHLIYLPRGHQQLLFVEDRRETVNDEQQGVLRLDDILTVQRDAGAVILPPLAANQSPKQPDDAGATTADMKAEPAETRPDEASITPPPSRTPKVGETADEPTSRISFFLFGVEHILTGYDHLLFLAALLLACTKFSEAASIITCFTIAHSVTLALAALDVVRLPGPIVESLIAASIVYVAIENLSTQPSLRRRVAITSFFGLIHGLGFASALREIGLGTIPGGVIWPLLKFNLGVEAGQLCVAAIIFPLLLWIRKSERLSDKVLYGGSTLIALMGGYWLVTRALGM